MKNLNALFYPQIVCLDETVLKYMLLNFDKIYFLPNDTMLNPGHTSIASRFSVWDTVLLSGFGTAEDVYYAAMYSSEKQVWDDRLKRLMETYEWLESEGMCIPLLDERFEDTTRPHPLRAAVDADLADPDFVDRCAKYQNEKCLLPANIPQGEIKGGGMVIRPAAHQGDMGMRAVCSERINATLYVADIHNLVPVSNHGLFSELFAAKLKRALSNPEFVAERTVRNQTHKFKLNVLSWTLFTEVIPKETIEAKTVKQIVLYTTEAAELRERYRGYLSMLESGMTGEPWETTFEDETDKLVRGKVIPEIERLGDEKKALWEKFFGELINATIQKRHLMPLVGVTLIPTVSYWDLLWYSTVGLVGSSWLSELTPKVVEFLVERRKVRRHGLFFLLNFK